MKIVRFEIKDHSDRMNILQALQDNGYDFAVKRDISYVPPKVFILVEVEDCEVKEE